MSPPGPQQQAMSNASSIENINASNINNVPGQRLSTASRSSVSSVPMSANIQQQPTIPDMQTVGGSYQQNPPHFSMNPPPPPVQEQPPVPGTQAVTAPPPLIAPPDEHYIPAAPTFFNPLKFKSPVVPLGPPRFPPAPVSQPG